MIRIGNKIISKHSPVFLIAEAGVNHNGSLRMALRLVDAAAKAGADAIKFQTFKAHQVVLPTGHMAPYQKKNIGRSMSQVAMLKKFELKESFYKPIISRCKQKNILFLSTPHGGFESVDLLASLRMSAYKIGSGDLTNLPLLRYVARLQKPIILSTGMATMKEIREAVRAIRSRHNNKFVVLHCTSSYPCLLKDVNLAAIRAMMKDLDAPIGYSDHTEGIGVSIMAAALGACVIEKHFTLNRSLPGPDHRASIEPDELVLLASILHSINTIMGSARKKPSTQEKKTALIVRKSIVSLKKIPLGTIFTKKNIGIKRPGTGLAPKYFDEILGKKARRNIRADQLITKADYEK